MKIRENPSMVGGSQQSALQRPRNQQIGPLTAENVLLKPEATRH